MTAISVIIPTYNRAELVTLAIESVLAQTHPAAEILVINDGSKDNTLDVLERYKNKVTIITQPNSGVSTARNTGIKAAQCEWISFLDDDDEYAPDHLAIASQSIGQFPNSKIHASNIAICMEGKPPIDLFQLRGLYTGKLTTLLDPLIWALRGCYFVQSLVVSKRTLNEVGGFRQMLFEDLDLVVRLTSTNPWIVDSRHSIRLIRRNSTLPNLSADWRSKPIERSEALVKIYRETIARPALSAEVTKFIQNGLAAHLYELGVALAEKNDFSNARSCFAESARTFSSAKGKLKSWAAYVFGKTALSITNKLRRTKTGLVR